MLLTMQSSLAQTPFTISYILGGQTNSSLTPSTTGTPFTGAITNTVSLTNVSATCSSTANTTGTSSTTLTCNSSYTFTITQITATGYASNAGAKNFKISFTNSNGTQTGTAVDVTSGTNCGTMSSIPTLNLTTNNTVSAGNTAIITVTRAAGADGKHQDIAM